MKKLILFILMMWISFNSTSQLYLINKTYCFITPNTYLVVNGNLNNESDCKLDNAIIIVQNDITNNGTLTMVGNSTLKCGRNWNNINGTFNAGNGTVVFDSNDGTINTGGNGANKKFYNVECNAAGKVKTLNGAIDCDNNFTITAGTWSAGGNSMNIAGNWTNNGIFTHGNNTVTFDGSANQTIKAGASPFYEVIINNSGNPITYNVSILSNMDIADTLKIKKGLFLINGGYSLNMTNSSIPSSTNVYIIDIYSGGILKLDNSSSQITSQDVDADIRVQQGGELNINAGTLTGFDYHQIEGNFNMTGGKLTTHNAGDKGRIKFTGTASGSQTAGIIEFNSLLQAMSNTSWYASGGLIRTIGSSDGSINVSEHNFYINNLEIYGNTNKNVRQTSNVSTGSIPDLDIRGYLKIYSSITLNSNNKDITIAGNWTNDGTYSYGSTGNTVIFNGNLDQTISGNNSTTFYNLNIDKTITKLILDVNNTTVKNNLTLTNGAIELNQKTLIIDNSSPAAINRINGYILSNTLDKNFNSKVQWNIGTTATGEYIFPFGISDTYIPFKFNVTTAGVGNLSVSTYPTGGTDASGVYSNKPNIVTNLNSPLYPDPPAPGNAINIVRRFWYINKSGGSGIADLTFSWAASEDPLSGAINTMIAQRYLEQINKWEYPPLDAQSSSILNTPRYVTVPNVINFSPWAITRNDHPLPISLLYFNGDCKDSIVVLNWATASEINNDYFTIEYTNSLNDEDVMWTPIGIVNGAGNSNTMQTYQFIDKPILRDINAEIIYYRLKQTDYNGNYEYFSSIYVDCRIDNYINTEIINAYCEQKNNCNVVTVLFKMPGEINYTIKLYNVFGQLLATTKGISNEGENITQLYINEPLKESVYIVILHDNFQLKTKKVLLY